MELQLLSRPSAYGATISSLQLNETHFCFTLEDEVREVPGQPVETWKVPKQTAIPASRYRVALVNSPRFGPNTFQLLDVPGFVGIDIHGGNYPEDTEGCLLTGETHEGGAVYRSQAALHALHAQLDPVLLGGGEVWLTITRNVKPNPDHQADDDLVL